MNEERFRVVVILEVLSHRQRGEDVLPLRHEGHAVHERVGTSTSSASGSSLAC
jgi:hypothetical protein